MINDEINSLKERVLMLEGDAQDRLERQNGLLHRIKNLEKIVIREVADKENPIIVYENIDTGKINQLIENNSIKKELEISIKDKMKALRFSVNHLEETLLSMIERRGLLRKSDVKRILDEFLENVLEIGINDQTKRVDKLYKKLGLV